MNAALIAQIFGWAQFLLPVATTLSTSGIHGFPAWATAVGSLAAAVGIHAASTTGTPAAPKS